MRSTQALQRLGLAVAVLAAACSESTKEPTALRDDKQMNQMLHAMNQTTTSVGPLAVTPFTYRATLAPFQLNQLPGFSMNSNAPKDIVIQQSVFTPGPGMWHTHPGPSFIYVLQGSIRLERVNDNRCVLTPVYTPGQAYFEIGNQVHRAIVTSDIDAVVLVTRFNVPPGAPFTIPAATPNC